jgi:hypothetical protein
MDDLRLVLLLLAKLPFARLSVPLLSLSVSYLLQLSLVAFTLLVDVALSLDLMVVYR